MVRSLPAEGKIFINPAAGRNFKFMAISREKKKEILEQLKEKIERQKITIFVNFWNVKANELFKLRKKVKEKGGELKVAKKNLVKIAFEKSKIKIEMEKLIGQIALVFGYEDEISIAKTVWEFSKENPNLKILAGIFENKFLNENEIIELAKLPAREEILREIVSTISAPILNFVEVLKANLRNFVFVLSQIKGQ